MLNFINKILNYFGYVVKTTEDIHSYEDRMKWLSELLDHSDQNSLSKMREWRVEKDRLINLVAEKDKDILALEHKVENFQWVIEQDKITIENLNKQTVELVDKIARLDTDIVDLSNQVNSYKQLASQRYKEVNLLRSNNKALKESRDNYKRKYREICWKIALKKCH